MAHLRFLTAGESHGPALIGILEGVPAGLPLTAEQIDADLARRQRGYGRGRRQAIESDRVEILGGVRDGRTLGSPIALCIRNRDWANWQDVMSPGPLPDPRRRALTRPRPGHADLAGALKYGHADLRNVLERASARETAMRVAVGAICRVLLREAAGIEVFSYVVRIGRAALDRSRIPGWDPERGGRVQAVDLAALRERIEASPVRTPDPEAEAAMLAEIDRARDALDTVGGAFEVVALHVPPGLGSHVHWDRRLDGRIAQALMSIQAIKAVEVGLGVEAGARWGSEVQDAIYWSADRGYYRQTNRLGGTEGGISNGEPIVVRATMKPIPTLRRPLPSVDMATKEPFDAARERSDTCAVPAAAVVGEAMLAWVLADALLEKFGGDSLEELRRHVDAYRAEVARR